MIRLRQVSTAFSRVVFGVGGGYSAAARSGVAGLHDWWNRLTARARSPRPPPAETTPAVADAPATYAVTRLVFLRLLGLIYLIAFVSLWVQIIGLVGRHGILPAQEWAGAIRHQLGLERYWLAPTLCWLNTGDGFLHGLCAAGVLASAALLFDVAPAAALIVLYGAYLSLATVCRDFLSFQWDHLLLETGFLAIFLAPLRARRRFRSEAAVSPVILWLLRWLLFRLMFASGVVKLASGDPAWRGLTALMAHYETQPLPTWIGWYAHQLPAWFHRASCLAMFAVELVIPWGLFGPRRLRLMAAATGLASQLLIIATGNYGFFNLLAIALCVLLLDDGVWPAAWRAKVAWQAAPQGIGRCWPRWVMLSLASLIGILSAAEMARALRPRLSWPAPLAALQRWTQPFRIVNGYGLFAVMTATRYEILVEGSRDGERWAAYEFRYKPGSLGQRPRFVAPHQPRVDWQMWVAALSGYRRHPWFIHFCGGLLRGSPEVLGLLAANPFPDGPPRYIRALVYEYAFTDPASKRADGRWWRRKLKGLYCPVLSLQPGAAP